jgi:hypothetical protein
MQVLFGNDEWLSSMLVFGKKLASVQLADNVGNVKWVPIEKANKAEKVFHGGRKLNLVTNSRRNTWHCDAPPLALWLRQHFI